MTDSSMFLLPAPCKDACPPSRLACMAAGFLYSIDYLVEDLDALAAAQDQGMLQHTAPMYERQPVMGNARRWVGERCRLRQRLHCRWRVACGFVPQAQIARIVC